MGRVKIDLQSWKRRKEYGFFSKMIDPTLSFTTEVVVDHSFAAAKSCGKSFFVYYEYAIIKAMNEIESFRLRVVSATGDGKNPEVYLYDTVHATSPIKISNDGQYIEMRIPYIESFDDFYNSAKEIISSASAVAASGKEIFLATNEEETYACISVISDLYFTGAKHCLMNFGAVDAIVLMNVGKIVEREGRKVMPLAVTVNHGLVDGGHIATLFNRIQEILDSL